MSIVLEGVSVVVEGVSVDIEGVSIVIEGVSVVVEGVSSFPVDFLSIKQGFKIPMQNVDSLLNMFGEVLESMTLMSTLYRLPFQHRKALNLPMDVTRVKVFEYDCRRL